MKRLLFILLAVPFFQLSLFSAGEAGMQFLKISPDARGNAMAGSVMSEVTVLDSLFWNPAGLARMSGNNAVVTYTKWLGDMSHLYLAYGMPLIDKRFGKIAASITYLSEGSLDQVTDTVNFANQDSFDLALNAGYGITLSKKLSVGGSAKYIYTKIIGEVQTAATVDAGAQYILDQAKAFRAGFLVKNIGITMKDGSSGDSLPMSLQLGGSYRSAQGDDLFKVTASGDYLLVEEDVQLNFGFEYGYKKALFLRAGYRYETAESSLSGAKGFTFGVGGSIVPPIPLFKLINMDVTWIPMGELGQALQLTTGVKF